ncbi:AAA family ATPase [Phenylobacterium sp.]|jgi:predicted ABC-type ATPase|uniref:AAA family ATPase n=1 Tax=Phenylobacterium sp. TaxID=1871053 RepID=UPI002F92ADAD
MAGARPTFHLLAGPNGAGKTSLYEAVIRRLTDAEFVNPDRLCFAELGRHALSRADAELGQRLAETRRGELMAASRSLVVETTFSHPSKLDLLRRARVLGYELVVYHLSLGSADEAVARVAQRAGAGGHPVPEANIRGRFARNPALIREAILLADFGHVFDNSVLGRAPRRVIAFVGGRPALVAPDLPVWARELYGRDLGPRTLA